MQRDPNVVRVFHIALEPIPSRYSAQWLECIRPKFIEYANEHAKNGKTYLMYDVVGQPIPPSTTAGGFLDFAATNYWKGTQQAGIAKLFQSGSVSPGDVFLFTDAWNPAVLAVRYMSELLDVPVRIVSYWHAGSYDTWDTLGYKIKDRTWSIGAEQSFFHASDYNLFATKYHANFFKTHCLREFSNKYDNKIVISGQPHYQILEYFAKNAPFTGIPMPDGIKKEKPLVVFPHRDCVEKQPEIFDALAEIMPQFQFIKTSDYKLSKDDYYKLLLNTDLVFSCAMHEMLGISMMEGFLAGASVMMPRRLSYAEMWDPSYLYPSRWTEPGSAPDLDQLKHIIGRRIALRDEEATPDLVSIDVMQTQRLNDFLTCEPMWKAIIGENVTYGL